MSSVMVNIPNAFFANDLKAQNSKSRGIGMVNENNFRIALWVTSNVDFTALSTLEATLFFLLMSDRW